MNLFYGREREEEAAFCKGTICISLPPSLSFSLVKLRRERRKRQSFRSSGRKDTTKLRKRERKAGEDGCCHSWTTFAAQSSECFLVLSNIRRFLPTEISSDLHRWRNRLSSREQLDFSHVYVSPKAHLYSRRIWHKYVQE